MVAPRRDAAFLNVIEVAQDGALKRLHAEYSFSEASLYPGKKAPSKSYLVPEQHAPGTPESLSGDSMA